MASLVNKCLLIPLWQCSRVTFTTDALYVSPLRVTFYIYLFSPELWSKKCITHRFFFCPYPYPSNSVRFLQKRPCNTTTGTKKLHPKSLAGACRLLSLTVSWEQRGFMLPPSLSSASRNADDPEVRLQQQFQLHRPPHFRFHALPAEDGEGAPEPATQPRNRWNQHRWPFFRHLGQGVVVVVFWHHLLFYLFLFFFTKITHYFDI